MTWLYRLLRCRHAGIVTYSALRPDAPVIEHDRVRRARCRRWLHLNGDHEYS